MHQQKRIYHLAGLFIITALSCVNENITNLSESVIVNQDVSFPLGPTSITIPDEIVNYSNPTPGPYGTFYYNGYPIPLNSGNFIITDLIKFDLGSHDSRTNWIKECMLRQIIENNFPVPATVQFYTINDVNDITDSVFSQGPVKINAADTDVNGIIIRKSVQQFDIFFEGPRLDHVKRAIHLLAVTWIQIPNLSTPIYLSSVNSLHIDLAARFHLEYNIKDLR